jgi:lipopolysaccharide transport system permease protein
MQKQEMHRTLTFNKKGRQIAVTTPVKIIRPSRGWASINFRELWDYHELLYFLTLRSIKVRYRQTLLGVTWAIIQPLLTMVVFSIFFGRLARMPSEGIPYPVFAYTALVPWMFFANAFTVSTNSLVDHERMITKVYFPRLMLPMAAVLAGLVDFIIAFIVLIGMMLFYGIVPTVAIWTIPFFTLLATATALGVGLWFSALNVQYRDVRYIIPFLTQLWLFVTPVAYPISLVPKSWRAIYGLNPMAGVVEGFRWALLGKTQAPGPMIVFSTVAVLGLLAGGLYFFRRMEKTFADVV